MSTVSLECDGRDALDMMFERMYPNSNYASIVMPNKCTRRDSGESILVDIIKQKMETTALPLTMRKRLMYERAMAS